MRVFIHNLQESYKNQDIIMHNHYLQYSGIVGLSKKYFALFNTMTSFTTKRIYCILAALTDFMWRIVYLRYFFIVTQTQTQGILTCMFLDLIVSIRQTPRFEIEKPNNQNKRFLRSFDCLRLFAQQSYKQVCKNSVKYYQYAIPNEAKWIIAIWIRWYLGVLPKLHQSK